MHSENTEGGKPQFSAAGLTPFCSAFPNVCVSLGRVEMRWASGSNVMLRSVGEVTESERAASKADALFNRRF